MLEATIFSYFAMNNIQDDIAAQQAGIVNYRAPSYGKFSTSLTTSYWFGTPRNVSASGLAMDVDKVTSTTVDKNNNAQAWVNFNQMIGNRYSVMEHLVPEQMFSTADAPAEGISAVKAIALANAAGQKIWTITQSNVEVALENINLTTDTESEIRNSVNAGKVVTTHEQSINFNGWIGEGYIIIDPTTGAGAYKIAGGGNGGALAVAFMLVLTTVAIFFGGSLLIAGGLGKAIVGLIIIGWEFENFRSWVEGIASSENERDFNENSFISILGGFMGFFASLKTKAGAIAFIGTVFAYYSSYL
ncbi:MAG: hypothetical protein ACI8SR_000454 [Oceanicoccus sp.]|jgi:hypothetical protein